MAKQGTRKRSVPTYPLLHGHVRNKKKLIPPILGFSQTTFISSIDLIFPEIVWIGILLDWHGLREGIDIVSQTLRKLWSAKEDINWYRFSEIAEQEPELTQSLGQDGLAEIQIAFATLRLSYLWPGLEWAESHEDTSEAKRRMSAVIRKYWNRFEQPYLTIIATIIYSMGISGRAKFAAGTVPDIEAIVSDWGSERAEAAASSVRAFSMAFFPHDASADSEAWCKHFWRSNYQMSSCELNDDAI